MKIYEKKKTLEIWQLLGTFLKNAIKGVMTPSFLDPCLFSFCPIIFYSFVLQPNLAKIFLWMMVATLVTPNN